MEEKNLFESTSPGKGFKIALIGECMVELQQFPGQGVQQTFGGDTLNTAIYMARLGKGLPLTVDYVTALGTDPFSRAMMAFWENEQVGSSLVQCRDKKLPGLYYIQLDAQGERSFHYWRGESAARRCFEYPGSDRVLSGLEDYDGVYLSGISLAILEPVSLSRLLAKLEALHAMGKPIFFDCNFRPHLWRSGQEAMDIYGKMFSLAHTVFLNREEGETLLNRETITKMHEGLAGAGVTESVIRDGENPCSVCWNGFVQQVPVKEAARVVDTTAAGDSFSAAYLTARIFGRTVFDAAMSGHRLAACVISCKGAVAPMEAMPFKDGFLKEAPGPA